MKDKIISFILFLIITGIILVMGVFGYIIYGEITGNPTIELKFDGDGGIPTIEYVGNGKDTTIETDKDMFGGIEDKSNSQQVNEIESKEYRHLYNQLNNTAKTIYDKLYENKEKLKTGTYTVQFGNTFQTLLSSEGGEAELKRQYQSAIEALVYENPEIFYLDATKMFINIEKITRLTGTKYNVYINNGNKPNYLADGFNSKQEIDEYQAQIEQVKDEILSKLEGKSDHVRIKIVHDYLRDTIEYDSTIAKDNIYNIYGALVSKVCVCEGYAKAFQYLMNEIGIDNVIVIGTGTNSDGKTENHAWNYVKLDEAWYAVDVTWDDPILIGNGRLPEKSKYQYFLKGSKTMNENHVTSGKFTDAGQVFIYPELSVEDYE